MADSIDEFRFQLNQWDEMFGRDGQLISVKEITN